MRILVSSLLLIVSGCSAQQNADNDPVSREQALAETAPWHTVRLHGVAFRALGQEPGWLLEIKNGEEILIVTNYGQHRVAHAYVEPQQGKAAHRITFKVDADTNLLIEGKPCTDSMSGEQFETTVTMKTGIQTLQGCGRTRF